jgi:hypothetical protein
MPVVALTESAAIAADFAALSTMAWNHCPRSMEYAKWSARAAYWGATPLLRSGSGAVRGANVRLELLKPGRPEDPTGEATNIQHQHSCI